MLILLPSLLWGQEESDRPIWREATTPADVLDAWDGFDCGDSLHCVIAGKVGFGIESYFLVTDDGGKSWEMVNRDIYEVGRLPVHHSDVSCISSSSCIVSSDSGYIYRVNPIDATWEKKQVIDLDERGYFTQFMFTPPLLSMDKSGEGILHIRAFDPNGPNSDTTLANLLFTTQDGGESWTELENLPLPPTWRIGWIESVSSLGNRRFLCYCITMDSLPQIALTTDGGETWRYIPLPEEETGYLDEVHFQFLDSLHGFMSGVDKTSPGLHSYLIRTDDGGETWHPVYHGKIDGRNAGFYSTSFRDTLNGIASVAGSIVRTSDGGRQWAYDTVVGMIPGTLRRGIVKWVTPDRGLYMEYWGALFIWDASISEVSTVTQPTSLLTCSLLSSNINAIDLSITLPQTQPVRATLWNTRGEAVAVRDLGRVEEGKNVLTMELPSLPDGAYYLQIVAGHESCVVPLRRMMR